MDAAQQIQNRFLDFSPAKKLELSVRLYYSARELKEAALRSFHPEWSEDRIQEEVRKAFLYART